MDETFAGGVDADYEGWIETTGCETTAEAEDEGVGAGFEGSEEGDHVGGFGGWEEH